MCVRSSECGLGSNLVLFRFLSLSVSGQELALTVRPYFWGTPSTSFSNAEACEAAEFSSYKIKYGSHYGSVQYFVCISCVNLNNVQIWMGRWFSHWQTVGIQQNWIPIHPIHYQILIMNTQIQTALSIDKGGIWIRILNRKAMAFEVE